MLDRFDPGESERWQDLAACLDASVDLWFGTEAQQRAATVTCHRCTVQDQCLAYALEHREEHGVWGGRTETELKELRRAITRRARRGR